jgi:MoxR-like ATPase
MADDKQFQFYVGSGEPISQREGELPSPQVGDFQPSQYIAGKGLRDAVNVALMLGQPLLVTGEPGTGKTQLAWSIAYELNLNGPLVMNTKTTSTARDLFYRYDGLRHFHDANLRQAQTELSAENYITYEALGVAILLSLHPSVRPPLVSQLSTVGPLRSLVLIDEIDKAPRDFPNDILFEIDEMAFTVNETGQFLKGDDRFRPFVLITSNSERNLPDPFLRRCVYYEIPFPDKEQLLMIINNRLKLSDEFSRSMLDAAIEHFQEIRALTLKKKPATAELIAWLRVLDRMKINIDSLRPEQADALALTYSVIAKNKDDLAAIKGA